MYVSPLVRGSLVQVHFFKGYMLESFFFSLYRKQFILRRSTSLKVRLSEGLLVQINFFRRLSARKLFIPLYRKAFICPRVHLSMSNFQKAKYPIFIRLFQKQSICPRVQLFEDPLVRRTACTINN